MNYTICEEHGHYYCPTCEREQEHRETLDKAVSRWSWNCSATECAQEIIQEDWCMDEIEETMQRNGFSEADIEAVVDAHGALS